MRASSSKEEKEVVLPTQCSSSESEEEEIPFSELLAQWSERIGEKEYLQTHSKSVSHTLYFQFIHFTFY
jgi:hypothetical protein